MVKDKEWPEYGTIVVAANLSNEESYHDALNLKLIELTTDLSHRIQKIDVHLLSAYPVAPINIAIELPDFDPNLYNNALRGQHLAMKELRQKFCIPEEKNMLKKDYQSK